MKNIFKLFSGIFLFSLVFSACEKDENQVVFQGGTNPVLTSSTAGPLVLNNANKDAVAMVLNWTNPDYKFNTGISSQDVAYVLQVDTAGKDFTSSNLQEKAIAKDLSITLTVKDLNTFLSKMELKANVQYNVEIRIKATLVGGTVPLYSNVIKIKITPYLDYSVQPPGTPPGFLDGNLWVVGDCFPGPDWSNPLPAPYNVTLKFTRIDVLHYELIADFDKTGGYKLIQIPGDWGSQYHAMLANLPLAGDFEKKDSDPQFASPGVGKYKIAVNFQTGKYTLTKM
jgi:starch-binding outer membrane protein SusE/F